MKILFSVILNKIAINSITRFGIIVIQTLNNKTNTILFHSLRFCLIDLKSDNAFDVFTLRT